MRVIKYGPGCQPKKIMCDSCKSELEYERSDVFFMVQGR